MRSLPDAGETIGAGQLFGIVPLPGGRVYWYGTQSRPAGEQAADEHAAVRERFTSWHEPIAQLIDATTPEAVLRHDIENLRQLPASFTRGRTALLGDAAHAMTPNLGQGAGQGIEDAATLALLLRDNDIDTALARYSTLRVPRTKQIWQRSRILGSVLQASNPIAVRARNALLKATPPATIGKSSNAMAQWVAPR